MRNNSSHVLRAHIFPILLGDGAEARRLAFRLWLATGIRSTVCGTKKSLLTSLSPFCRFFELPSTKTPSLLAEALCHLVADTELLGTLIPCNEDYECFLAEQSDDLSPYFLIRTKEDALSLPPLSEL